MEKAFSQDNPYTLFDIWLEDACASEINDPNAMSLATVLPDGSPSVRIVLLKDHDPRGFVFYTNSLSNKGQELADKPFAEICFHWKSLRRQIRVHGTIEQVSEDQANAYFNSRPRLSQIGAWASEQSQPLASRQTLVDRVEEMSAKYPDTVPRPPHWTGYRLKPEWFEFWHDGEGRLHDRFRFTNEGENWHIQRLNP